MSMIRVLAIDDHRMITDWVDRVCVATDDIEVMGRYAGLEGVPIPARSAADIVLLDLMLEESLDKWAVLDEVLTWGPKVIVMSALNSGSVVHRALVAGATSYIGKSATAEEFTSALRMVASGASGLVIAADPPRDLAKELTPALAKLLSVLVETTETRELAKRLFLSERTIDAYIAKIYDILQTEPRNRARLVDQARTLGF